MSNQTYTLQPLPYELSVEQQQQAQYSLWQNSNRFTKKQLAILAVVIIAALAGLYFTEGYSTIIFWLMLVGSIAFIAAKKYGLAWYIKKQIGQQPVQAMSGIKMGVQPQGIILIQRVGAQEGRALIGWDDVKEWRETSDYIYVFFQTKGQKGAHIIPKAYAQKKFPIETVRYHLTEKLGKASTDVTLPSLN